MVDNLIKSGTIQFKFQQVNSQLEGFNIEQKLLALHHYSHIILNCCRWELFVKEVMKQVSVANFNIRVCHRKWIYKWIKSGIYIIF